jgi:hypothetical protein
MAELKTKKSARNERENVDSGVLEGLITFG